ncbi:unnamed protein product, partial [Rodentolepis nana]
MELFDSRKYTSEEPPRRSIKRSHSEPSISYQAEEYGSVASPATTIHSSWYSLFEDANSDMSQQELNEVPGTPEQQELRDHVSLTSPPLQQQSSVTDSGFTTSIETPHLPPIMSPTPIPSESEQMPSMRTVLMQLLEEADGVGNTDFDEKAESEDLTTLMGDVEENGDHSFCPSRFFIAEQMRMALTDMLELETLVKCYNVI